MRQTNTITNIKIGYASSIKMNAYARVSCAVRTTHMNAFRSRSIGEKKSVSKLDNKS